MSSYQNQRLCSKTSKAFGIERRKHVNFDKKNKCIWAVFFFLSFYFFFFPLKPVTASKHAGHVCHILSTLVLQSKSKMGTHINKSKEATSKLLHYYNNKKLVNTRPWRLSPPSYRGRDKRQHNKTIDAKLESDCRSSNVDQTALWYTLVGGPKIKFIEHVSL